ncbi:hypothetical protein NBRC111894_2043 [Sporolactobacillus inulinus]|uniref:Uncharacterized protein n=1 Tax=Sporolactobacillus inulinus TaxID=2078 RepID=A0A4Y1ZBT7_9BACL|nr:hypothetical protein NBRC111894_2043 [Sporolactobacillus inulinus]
MKEILPIIASERLLFQPCYILKYFRRRPFYALKKCVYCACVLLSHFAEFFL